MRRGDPWACDFDKDFRVLRACDRAGCRWDRICAGGVTTGIPGLINIAAIVDGVCTGNSMWYVTQESERGAALVECIGTEGGDLLARSAKQ